MIIIIISIGTTKSIGLIKKTSSIEIMNSDTLLLEILSIDKLK